MGSLVSGSSSNLQPVPRNQIFRPRQVLIRLEHGNEVLSVVELAEVKTINVSSTGSTAVLPGVIQPVLQPWNFMPVIIELSGESYMGAFAAENLNIVSDNDVSRLWRIRQQIDDLFSSSSASIKNLRTRLTIGKQGGPKDYARTREWVGNLDDIRDSESDDKPYVWTYTIKFTGLTVDTFNMQEGSIRYGNDAVLAAATKTTRASDKSP